jgi:pimeloyl-ACP methyl ester carboxylesterase
MNTLTFNLNGGQISCEETGSGPLVLCVPSMGDLRGEYRFLAPRLAAAGYRVVSMDVRGHGQSSTAWADFSVAAVGSDALALIRALDAGPAILIGDSMAGGAAVWAAVEAPELVSGLVLIDPFVRGESTWFTRLLYGLLFTRPWGPVSWSAYYNTLYPSRKPDDFGAYRQALQANLAQPGRMEALQAMLAASKRASEERLARVRLPALVIMGSKDPDFKDPAAEAAWVAEQIHAAFQMVPGAGHYPHAEMPDLAASLILPFLVSVASPAGPAREQLDAA